MTAIQPLESSAHLVLHSGDGRAEIEAAGSRRAVPIRANERLTTIAQTPSGWIAGGVRQDREGSSVVFVADQIGLPRRLPPLPQRRSIQLLPVLLLHDGDLQGAAWLEGESHRSLAVRFADWNGVDWSHVTTVASPGPGSQTGLTGAALRGGELLLTWSRFDGTDDELFWSWRAGASWSRPARVGANNRSPDITPALASAGRGATLVWSRLDDGEYRMLARSFDSGTWESAHEIGGPGSLFPSLIRQQGHLFALYRSARPKGWSIVELGNGSTTFREAHVDEPSAARPIVAQPSASGPVLRWQRTKRSAQLRWELRRE